MPEKTPQQHARRWKRTAAAGLLLLAGGAVVNVAVAWGCSIWSTAGYDESIVRRGSHAELDHHLREGGLRVRLQPGEWLWADANVVGAHWVQMGRPCPDVDCDPLEAWHQHLAGFPMRSLACHGSVNFPPQLVGGEIVCDVNWQGGFNAPPALKPKLTWFSLLPSVSRPLPLWVLPVGFTINTAFYAALLWLLFFAPFAARRMLRRRRGLCEKCAYPIGTSPVCTECGAAVVGRGIRPVQSLRGSVATPRDE